MSRPSGNNTHFTSFGFLIAALITCTLSSCTTPEPYVYRYHPGHTATMQGPYAVAPASAPAEVHAAVAAGNRIAGLPYQRGGGHGSKFTNAYDCSGATSFILEAAGKLSGPRPSSGFLRYGESGKGKWISVYARKGHVFLVVAGLRFDTGYGNGARGPQWTMRSRPTKGYRVRHPSEL